MSEWRVFVGDDEPTIDQTFAHYDEARAMLASHLAPFLSDVCRDCQISGTLAMQRLAQHPVDTEFADEVDGSDYAITRPGHEDISDLLPAYDPTECERCNHPIRFHLFGPCIMVDCDCPDSERFKRSRA